MASTIDIRYGSDLIQRPRPVGPASTEAASCKSASLLTILTIAQAYSLDVVALTWQDGQGNLGCGAFGQINQSTVDAKYAFAFKRSINHLHEVDIHQQIAELKILCHPLLRKHENLVKLEGISFEIRGHQVLPVFVLEKAPHGDLSQFMRLHENASLDVRFKICQDIATGLLALHQHQIIHGDLKPKNVLVYQRDDGIIHAKLTDFGGSVISEDSDLPVLLTQYSHPWAAPERYLNQGYLSRDDAKKSDTFSFGMIWLWLVCSVDEDLLEQWRDSGQLIEQALLCVRKLHVDECQQNTLQRFLSSSLANHVDSRMDMTNLTGYLDGVDITQLRPNESMVKKHDTFRVSILFGTLLDFDSKIRSKIADLLERDAKTSNCDQCAWKSAFELAVCYWIGCGRSRNVEEASFWLKQSGLGIEHIKDEIKLMNWYQYSNPTLQSIEKESDLQKIDSSLNPETKDRTKGELTAKIECYTMQLKDLVDSLGERHVVTLKFKRVLASLLYENDNMYEAEKLLDAILVTSVDSYGKQSPFTLGILVQLAAVHSHTRGYDQALLSVEEALRGCNQIDNQNRFVALNIKLDIARLYVIMGRYEEALQLSFDAYYVCQKRLGEDHNKTLQAMSLIAAIYFNQNKYDDSLAWYQKLLPGQLRILGETNPSTIEAFTTFSKIYKAKGCVDEALLWNQRALENTVKVFGEDSFQTRELIESMAELFTTGERYQEAREWRVRELEDLYREFGRRPDDVQNTLITSCLRSLVVLELRLNNLEAAGEYFYQYRSHIDNDTEAELVCDICFETLISDIYLCAVCYQREICHECFEERLNIHELKDCQGNYYKLFPVDKHSCPQLVSGFPDQSAKQINYKAHDEPVISAIKKNFCSTINTFATNLWQSTRKTLLKNLYEQEFPIYACRLRLNCSCGYQCRSSMILTKQLDEETQLLLPYSAGEIFVERSALFRYSINSGELFASPWSPLINQLSGPIKSPPSLDIEYLFLCFGSKKPDPTFVDVSMYGLETDYDIFSRIFDVYQEETGWFTLRKISSMKMVKFTGSNAENIEVTPLSFGKSHMMSSYDLSKYNFIRAGTSCTFSAADDQVVHYLNQPSCLKNLRTTALLDIMPSRRGSFVHDLRKGTAQGFGFLILERLSWRRLISTASIGLTSLGILSAIYIRMSRYVRW